MRFFAPVNDSLLAGVVAQSEPGPGFPQNLPYWPQATLPNFLLTVVLFSALSLLAYWILFSALRNLAYRSRRRADDIFLNTVRTPLLIFLITFGVLRSLEVLDLDPNVDILLTNLFWVVVIATGFVLAWRITREVLIGWLKRHARETENEVDDLLVPTLNTLGPLVFSVTAIAVIMSYLGIDVSLFLVSIGALGLILGLAFQDSLSNLFSGVYLLLNPPFHEGDMIILSSGTLCTVKRVGLRMTALNNLDQGALMYVPNNKLAGETIINVTKPTADLSASSKVSTLPDYDPDVVKGLLSDILASHRNILNSPSIKIAALRKRMEAYMADGGAASERLKTNLDDLEIWDRVSDERDEAVRRQLNEVRKGLSNQVDKAQDALKTLQGATLPQQRDLRRVLDNLALVLRQTPADDNTTVVGLDADRMQQLSKAFDEVVAATDAQARSVIGGAMTAQRFDLTALTAAMAAIGDLDYRENQLEAALNSRQTERDDQFTKLTAALKATAEEVANGFTAAGRSKEAKRIKLWAENIAIAYAEQEVLYTVEGLDHEIDGLTAWLGEIEAGGVTKEERIKIRALFSGWGGIDQLERRRLDELRRRLLRWVELKEDGLSKGEHDLLIDAWERRLRSLSRRLHETRIGDEEELDSRLQAVRAWVHSQEFIEPVPDWKWSSPGFNWGEAGYDFGMYYFVDDIRLDHYQRKAVVAAQLRGDVYEVFKQEHIEMAFPRRDLWVHGPATPTPSTNGDGETNGRVRAADLPISHPPAN